MSNELKTIGLIEDVTFKEGEKQDGSKWKRASFQIAGQKYGTFAEATIDHFKQGMTVECTYTQDGNFKTIVQLKQTTAEVQQQVDQAVNQASTQFTPANSVPEPPKPVGPNTQDMIVRQNCMSNAIRSLQTLNEIDPDKAKEVLKANEGQMIDLLYVFAEALEVWVKR